MVRGLIVLLLLVSMSFLQAQDLGYGFRAGLSYSKFVGDSEQGVDGQDLEAFSFASGFHIGFIVNYRITDLFGLRGELMYTQKGTEYDYDGESWFIVGKGTSQTRQIDGVRKMSYDISTASIELPLSAYHRLGPLEFSLGVSPSFLLGASAGGSIEFDGRSRATGNPISPFEVNLNYNYFKDEAGQGSQTTVPVVVDGQTFLVPMSIGAYYDFEDKDGNALEFLDIGLLGGISFYLNESLFLGARGTLGLLDVDDNQYDISFRQLGTDQSLISRSDKNTSLSLQVSIGFSF